MRRAKTVEEYITAGPEWQDCLILLRELFNTTRLEEGIKWGMPVYTLENKNVAGFSAFKSYVGIWFYQGVFLSDPEKKLISAQARTKGMRQWRFSGVEEIMKNRNLILRYLEEAIRNQAEGKEIQAERKKEFTLPAELLEAFRSNPALKDRFEGFTPGKRREFAQYISEAKQEKTRLSRLEKVTPLILEGIGLNDRYRK